ncbi:MAG: hypothetical protein ACKV19_06780 [Verrucomicrobiales bacterium]
MTHLTRFFGASLAWACAATLVARDTDQVPARVGLQQLADRFGRPSVRHIVEMTGASGDPQPQEWRVTASAPGRSDLLREFWIGDGRVTDEGLDDDFYPERLPKGFFSLDRVKLDSTQAFAMAEQVARDAGIGFDAVNYKLHCREYSDEPVWTLTLLDREETIVGSVHISADSGRMLRTVWMRRLPNGRLAVEDSGRGDRPLVQPRASSDPADPTEDPPVPIDVPLTSDPATSEPPPEEIDPASPDEPAPAPATDDGEIPEIKKLQEAQEKTGR